ncbi:hypothetical protein E3N88_30561 [Mikania micrantha]|uniref:Reverse transcriptase domain-containing protein n=1 Tax=Mikania micrantha TaxID=192012 RepID=A0A5N6MP80_9ASTR|nr:hypothetical protein E3N88_30561 [Mikania micrantha]
MADGTRFKILDDSVKVLQESNQSIHVAQDALRSDVSELAASVEDQKKTMNKVLVQLSLLTKQSKQKGTGGPDGETSDGMSILGRHKPAPIYLARFAGTHPERWVAQANRYFEFYSIPDHERLMIASFYLDEDAADWFDWLQRQSQQQTWTDFTKALVQRFKAKELEQPEGLLAKLNQTTTVAAYRHQFEEISNRTMILPQEFLVHCFILGLRADIKQSVIIHRPTTIEDAMNFAQLHENRIQLEKGLGRLSLGSSKAILPTPTKTQIPNSNTTSTGQPKTTTSIGFRRLTPTELNAMRNSPIVDIPAVNSSTVISDSDLAEALQVEELTTQSAISYNALFGGCSASTLRFSGHIKGKAVQVLLDGGSTHCFVQTRVASFLNLTVESITPFSILVGSGERLPCSGIAKQVELKIQKSTVIVDLYVLPLQGWDLVLGVSWLSTLGPVVTNYAAATFEFVLNGTKVLWQGDTTSNIQPIQFNGLRRLAQTDAIADYVHFRLLPDTSPLLPFPTDIQPLVEEFSAMFTAPSGLPPSRLQDHGISLQPDKPPVSVRPYRYPHFQKQEIEKLVTDMLQQGIIRHSNNPYSSPVLLVRKKDGTWRFCVDYRALNAITIRDRFPIPSIDELFDELHGARFFSKFDLLSGYHQIRLQKNAIAKTAFRTHEGHYEFLVMPFGLSNAPSTFQRLMNDVFRPYLRKFVLVFFDDILVYSSSWVNHLAHLRVVLQTLATNSLVAKLSKCTFGQQNIAYLGHYISAQGLSVDQSKIAAIQSWPTPKTVKDIRGFLGLTGYYRRFIRNYATVASPLTDLLKKDSFSWSQQSAQAFTHLKNLMSSTPVLRLPDFSKPFTVETDASGTGIGAVLSQEKQPIAFYSQKLCPRMQQQSAYVREMFAITQAISKWRQYLLGSKFNIITDQQSLRNLQEQVIQTPEQHKWLGKLLGYDFEILYRPGKNNGAADALSRIPYPHLAAFTSQGLSFLEELRKEIFNDSTLQTLCQQIQHNPLSKPEYTYKDGLLFYQGRLYIPKDSPKNKEIMSPEEGKSQPKLRRSKRVKETNSKMRDYVCQATSAIDN